jgi:hypothetical protein
VAPSAKSYTSSTGFPHDQQVERVDHRRRLDLAIRQRFERRLPTTKLFVREQRQGLSARSRVRAASSLRLEQVC